ncbi:Dynamin family-domain-containing protein [Mycena filopes]|nr:Dynamin family-domain-containing protein [Mycena filopes]
MDVDSNESESGRSDDSSEDDSFVHLPAKIRDFVVTAVKTLSRFIKAFPDIPRPQQKMWKKSVTRILDRSTLPTYKFALLGKTGAGKSTLINCLLGQSIVPTSAAGACTSAITEISYVDSDDISATISFLSRSEWEEELKRLLADITSEENDDLFTIDPSKSDSEEKLFMIYPELRSSKENIATCTAAQLLKMDPVRTKLGTTVELPLVDSPDIFRTQLEEYISSSLGRSQLWPLVKRVTISGRFSVLTTGMVLVDLPGHGDHDNTRNNFATEYIKSADGVILVTDAKRAQNDRDTLSHLRATLSQVILDGRTLENFLLLAVTGTDTIIGDNEILLENDDLVNFDPLDKELKDLRRSLSPLKKSTSANALQKQIYSQIKRKQKEKTLLLANVRKTLVRRNIHDFCRRHCNTAFLDEVPRLPIFCVSNTDYLALGPCSTTEPTIFSDEDETEIPSLQTHLQNTAERRRLEWADHILDDLEVLSEGVHSYFSENRYPGRLSPADAAQALALILDREKANLEEAEEAFDAVEEALEIVKDDLMKATEQAAKDGPRVMRQFGLKIQCNTYQACMRYNGVFKAYDINRDLTRNILPTIHQRWNIELNHNIPRLLKDATAVIQKNVLATISQVIGVTNGQGVGFRQSMAAARKSLGIEALLRDVLEEATNNIGQAQRTMSRSFHSTIQKEMTPQYRFAAQQHGRGTLIRMTESNVHHLKQNGTVMFNSIGLHFSELFDDAVAETKEHFETELTDLTTLLRLALIDEVNMSKADTQLKAGVLQTTLNNRPAIHARKMELSDRQRSRRLNGNPQYW